MKKKTIMDNIHKHNNYIKPADVTFLSFWRKFLCFNFVETEGFYITVSLEKLDVSGCGKTCEPCSCPLLRGAPRRVTLLTVYLHCTLCLSLSLNFNCIGLVIVTLTLRCASLFLH
jgi:hypothetical protein